MCSSPKDGFQRTYNQTVLRGWLETMGFSRWLADHVFNMAGRYGVVGIDILIRSTKRSQEKGPGYVNGTVFVMGACDKLEKNIGNFTRFGSKGGRLRVK